MSEKNPERKRTARERLAVERAKQKAGEKRRRALIVSSTVVCVLALAGVIGALAANAGNGKADTEGPVRAPSGVNGDKSPAIPVGKESARSTLTVWEDFRCPACKSFEDAYRSTIHELTDSGRLKVDYHLATLIDGNMGGSGSLRSANAAACAQNAGKFPEYHDVLFQNQPPETSDEFADNGKLIELADKVGGLDTPTFRKCVEDGTHNSWVAKSNKAFQSGGFQGTPTVLLNGENIYQDRAMTPAKLKRMIEESGKS